MKYLSFTAMFIIVALQLEREIEDAQTRIRYRNISETECIELALLKERYNTFMEFSGHILALLKL